MSGCLLWQLRGWLQQQRLLLSDVFSGRGPQVWLLPVPDAALEMLCNSVDRAQVGPIRGAAPVPDISGIMLTWRACADMGPRGAAALQAAAAAVLSASACATLYIMLRCRSCETNNRADRIALIVRSYAVAPVLQAGNHDESWA